MTDQAVAVGGTVELLRSALGQVEAGKIDFSEVLDSLLTGSLDKTEALPQRKAAKVKPLTEAHRQALTRLSEVYGVVNPEVPRALTAQELRQIVEERQTIDTLLSLLKGRKDESIREVLANHLDEVLSEDEREGAFVNDKGHYVVKHEVSVPGTDQKVQAIASQPSPAIDGAALLALYESGEISREDYLAVTVATRHFDEGKARKAFKSDPGLLLRVGRAIKKADPTLTIKVAKA